jgi:hypothetical protein
MVRGTSKMNGTIVYVQITNKCPEKVRIYFRYVMYTKPSLKKKRKKFINLLPNRTTYPIARANLVGARNWDEISSRPCILIEAVQHEPQFYYVKNVGKAPLTIPIKPILPKEVAAGYPKRKKVVVIKPGAVSRAIDKRSFQKPEQLQEFIRSKRASIRPADIGPGREGTYGSFQGEDVYICYECGGPIVFRGHPPRPVHI